MLESNHLITAVQGYYDYICAEILATEFTFVTELNSGIDIDINEYTTKISINKV
jgi:hypothetical protein